MTKLIGYQKKEGKFTNKETGEVIEYNNTQLYCVTDEKEDVKGLMAIELKAKTEDLQIIGAANIDAALNKEVYLITDITGKADENGKIKNLIAKIIVV